MILFLDFDGVLHPFPMGPSDKPFSAVAALWKILEKFPEISVVITSTWRERYPFPVLVRLLAAQGGERYTGRFIGVTPDMAQAIGYVPGIRQREIELWLDNSTCKNTPHLILDDIEQFFDSSCKELYLVDGVTGLTDHDVDMVTLWIKSQA